MLSWMCKSVSFKWYVWLIIFNKGSNGADQIQFKALQAGSGSLKGFYQTTRSNKNMALVSSWQVKHWLFKKLDLYELKSQHTSVPTSDFFQIHLCNICLSISPFMKVQH